MRTLILHVLRCLTLILLVGIPGRPALEAAGSLIIPLTVNEELGITRSGEAVTAGVPLPREAGITGVRGLALLDASSGRALDAGFSVTARWGGSPEDSRLPIRWLLVHFRCNVEAGQSRSLILTDLRPPEPAASIELTRDSNSWIVDTGPEGAVFEIPTGSARLFSSIRLNDAAGAPSGLDLLAGSADDGPYLSVNGVTSRAASAEGGCSLEVFRRDEAGQSLVLLLRGSHRSYGPGDPEASTDDDLDFAATLSFAAGSRSVLIRHTVQNNRDWVVLENNADFREIQSAHNVSFDEQGIRLAPSPGAASDWIVSLGPEGPSFSGTTGQQVMVYQDNTGDDDWDLWRNRRSDGNPGNDDVSNPVYGPQAYVRTDLRGLRITQGSTELFKGSTAENSKMCGYLAVEGTAGGVTAAIRKVWERYPKALRITEDGALELALFPEEFRARHVMRVGEEATDEVLLVFHGPGRGAAAHAAAIAFQKPLVAVVDPAWASEISRVLPIVSTGADPVFRFPTVSGIPELLIPDVTPEARDAYLARHLEGPGETEVTFDGLAEAVTASQMYSWMDWGDLPIDFEQEFSCGAANRSITGQYGWKYDGDWGLLASFLRSGDLRFLERGLAATAHTADIDILHHGRQSGRGISDFRDGGSFGHSQHNNDGDRNPHRNGVPGLCPEDPGTGGWNGTPTLDVAFGGQGLALAWELTGQRRYFEALLDLADWTVFYVETYGVGQAERSVANAINILSAALEVTGEQRYRDAANIVVAEAPNLAGPMPRGWFGGWFARSLGRLAALFGQSGDDALLEELDGLAGTPQQVVMDPETGSYSGDVDFYAGDLCRADAYAWGALLLDHDRQAALARAREAFSTGMLFPFCAGCYYGHSLVWQAKEWVVSLSCGHVYELAAYDAAGGPRFAPAETDVTPVDFPPDQNTPPRAVITAPLTVNQDEQVLLDGEGSSDPETSFSDLHFFWDFGDGVTREQATVVHTWSEAGSYTVRLWVGDGEAVGYDTVNVNVPAVNHPPTADAGPDRSAPVGTAIRFDGRGSSDPDGDALTYHWDFGDGTVADAPVVTHAFTEGEWAITLSVTDGTEIVSDQVQLRVVAGEETEIETVLTNTDGGPRLCEDTYIFSDYAVDNFGRAESLAVSRQNNPQTRTLMRFALDGVPAASLVVSATLELQVTSLPYDTPETTVVTVRRLLRPFGEDGASWLAADVGEAWSTAGGDLDTVESEAVVGPVGGRLSLDVTDAVQDWLSGLPNDGLALDLDPAENYHISWYASCDAAETTARPTLSVRYRPPEGGIPPEIVNQPEGTSITAGESATLTVTATGDAPLSYAWYEGTSGETDSPVGGNAPAFSTPLLQESTAYWVRVSNASGHVDSSTAVVQVVPADTSPPEAVITDPVEGAELSDVVEVVASLSDDTSLESAVLLIDASPAGRRVEAHGSEDEIILQLDTTLLPDGLHTLGIRVRDMAGNTGESAWTTVGFANDLSPGPPVRSIRLGPCPDCTPTDFKMIRLDALDPDQPGLSDLSFELGRPGGGLWFLLRWDLSDIPPGTRVVEARVVVAYTPVADPGWPWNEMLLLRPVEDPDGLGSWDPSVVSFSSRRPGTSWTAGGGDLDSSVGSTILGRWYGRYTSMAGHVQEDRWQIPTSLIQQWIDHPASNQGLAVSGVSIDYGSAGTLGGPDHPVPELRPWLEVEIEDFSIPGNEPEQVRGVRVSHDGAGRTFVTWNELEDENVIYRIYRHGTPITANNLALAERVAEVEGNGSSLAPIRTALEGYLLPPAVAGETYEVNFHASGSDSITEWLSSSLPDGLVMEADGRLHGTAVEPERRQITIIPRCDHPDNADGLAFTVTLAVEGSASPSPPASSFSIQPNPYMDDMIELPSGTAERRWAVRNGEGELPAGTGMWVAAPEETGMAYYAVTAMVNGQENRSMLGPENAPSDPVEEVVGDGEPVLQSGPLSEEYYGEPRLGWVWAFWPGHGLFESDPAFPALFRLVAPVPLDPATPRPVHFSFGGYTSTYMMPPYTNIDDALVVIPECRTPVWDGFNGHTLSDWFVGTIDTLGRIDARPADGVFHYYGVERSQFIKTWLTEGPGETIYGVDPDRIVAWGGSQGGTGILFTVLRDPGLFAAAQANVPCLDWYSEDHGNLWTSGTFEYLAGRESDHVLDVDGVPTVEALDASTRLACVADSPEARDFPQLAVLSGWNDPTLYWDEDDPEFAAVVADAGLPMTFVWHDGGHWTNASAPFLTDAAGSRPVIGVAHCSSVSSPVPPDNAEDSAGSDSVSWSTTGSINGDPLGFENGAYPSHIRIGSVQESETAMSFEVKGEESGSADLSPLRRRRFLPQAGSEILWTARDAAGGIIRTDTAVVDLNGRFTLGHVPFNELGVTVVMTESGCNPDGMESLDAADLVLLMRAVSEGFLPPGPSDCAQDGPASSEDILGALASLFGSE